MRDDYTNTPSREETARLGKEIYERDIRSLVEADHHGEVVAIDVDSGSYAIGKNAIAASDGLREKYPEAQVWLMRVGYRTLRALGAVPFGGPGDRGPGERQL